MTAICHEKSQTVKPTWEGCVEPLERISDRLGCAWGTVMHLKAVKDTPALRAAVDEVQPEKVKLSMKLAQSRPLYEAFAAMAAAPGFASLPEARRRVVEGELRDARLAGVGLEGAAKERFNEIQQVRPCPVCAPEAWFSLPAIRHAQGADALRAEALSLAGAL